MISASEHMGGFSPCVKFKTVQLIKLQKLSESIKQDRTAASSSLKYHIGGSRPLIVAEIPLPL